MNDCNLIMAITGAACAIINNCSNDEISLMSAAFNQLGDTLATYLTQKSICNTQQSSKENSSNNTSNKDDMQAKI